MTTQADMNTDLAKPGIPVIYSRILSSAVGQSSTEMNKILHHAGLSGGVNQPGYMSNEQYKLLLESAREVSGDPLIALRAGKQVPFSVHGPLGIAAMSSDTLGQALDTLARFSKLRMPYGSIRFEARQETSYFHVTIDDAFGNEGDAVLDFLISTFCTSFFEMISSPLVFFRLNLKRPEPVNSLDYRKILGVDVHFNCDSDCLVLATSDLDILQTGRNPEEYSKAVERLRELYKPFNSQAKIEDAVVNIFVQNTGHICCLEDIAEHLHITPRTLQRKLRDRGYRFHILRDKWLAEQASSYLFNECMTMDVTANLLGYSDTSNFRRSFKRWFGGSPSTFQTYPNLK